MHEEEPHPLNFEILKIFTLYEKNKRQKKEKLGQWLLVGLEKVNKYFLNKFKCIHLIVFFY